jgi:uncharacterized membrane protein
MNLNLIFAVGWLVAAAAIFLSRDERLGVHFGGVPLSSGWVAIVLALYNLARWWSIRSSRRQRQAEREALAERMHRRHDEERPEPVERDPNFNFGDPPPGPEAGPRPGP